MAEDDAPQVLHGMFTRFLGAYGSDPAGLTATYAHLTQLFVMMSAVNFNRGAKTEHTKAATAERDALQRVFGDAMERQKGLHFLITRGVSALNYMATAPLAGPTLDLGCADGYSSFLIFDEAFTYGVDITEKYRSSINQYGRHGEYLVGSADAIPLPDASVQTVVMNNVLYHVANRDAVMAEVKRVLRPGGTFLFDDATPAVFDVGNRPFLALLKDLGGGDYVDRYNRMRHTMYMEDRTINPLLQLVSSEYPAYLRGLGFEHVQCRPTMSPRLFKLAYAYHDVEYLMNGSMPAASGRVRSWVLDDLVDILIQDRDVCAATGGCYTFCMARKPQ